MVEWLASVDGDEFDAHVEGGFFFHLSWRNTSYCNTTRTDVNCAGVTIVRSRIFFSNRMAFRYS